VTATTKKGAQTNLSFTDASAWSGTLTVMKLVAGAGKAPLSHRRSKR